MNAVDEEVAKDVIDYGIAGYMNAATLYQYTGNTAEHLYENGYDEATVTATKDFLSVFSSDTSEFRKEFAKIKLDYNFGKNSLMPWSYEKLDKENYVKLLDMASEKQAAYNEYLDYFDAAWNVAIKYGDFNVFFDYCFALYDLAAADATYTVALYHYVCVPHLEQMDKEDYFYKSAIESVSMLTYAEKLRTELPDTITAQDVENYATQAENRKTELIQIIGRLDAMK